MFSRPFSLLGSPLHRLGSLFLAVAALAGCGGNSVVEPFQPARIVSLGDEYSYISDAGRKYTVNDTGGCERNPIWNQKLADAFGFSFPQCNAAGRDASRALLLAKEGATSSSIAGQIDPVSSTLGSKDLVSLMIGANDIWNAHRLHSRDDEAIAAVRAAAAEVINQVRRMVERKSNVVLLTVPNQGDTPEATRLGVGDRLRLLTSEFNGELLRRLNDPGSPTSSGRNVGLVAVQVALTNPAPFPNVSEGACGTAAEAQGLACDDRVNPNYAGFLHADARYLSPEAHLRIAAAAESRVRNNPF